MLLLNLKFYLKPMNFIGSLLLQEHSCVKDKQLSQMSFSKLPTVGLLAVNSHAAVIINRNLKKIRTGILVFHDRHLCQI